MSKFIQETQLIDLHLKRLFMMMVAAMTTSCAVRQAIPENWKLPVPVEGQKCPDISGLYMDKGESTSKWMDSILFTQFAMKGEFQALTTPPANWKGEHQVLIRQETETQLEILYMTDSGVILSSRILRKEKGDFSCKDGWIRVEEKTYSATSSAASFSTRVRSFTKAGYYLMEKYEWKGFTMFLILPWFTDGTEWFRFSYIER